MQDETYYVRFDVTEARVLRVTASSHAEAKEKFYSMLEAGTAIDDSIVEELDTSDVYSVTDGDRNVCTY